MGNTFISFLVFLSLLQCFSISEHVAGKNALRGNWRANPNEFTLVNPRQINYLEVTIRRFLTTLASPINGSIVLKATSPNANHLQLTIREICGSTRKKLMEFAKQFGLVNSVKEFEKSFENIPLSEDWYSELMLQNAYIIRDISNLINEIGSYVEYFATKRNIMPRGRKEKIRQNSGFRLVGVVDKSAEYCDALYHCLIQVANDRNRRSSYDLNQRIVNLVMQPPEVLSRILRSKLNNDSYDVELREKKWPTPYHALVCHSAIVIEHSYKACIRDLEKLETCMNSMNQSSDGGKINGERFWMKAIRRLSDCQISSDGTGKTEIYCKSLRRVPRDMKQKMKYVFERVLDKKISRDSPFHRVSNDLGETLSKSKWGQEFVDELCQYISIFEDGKTKLKSISMIKKKDKNTMKMYKEVSDALKVYKRGVLLRAFTSIKKIHHVATDFEKLLAQGIKKTFNEAWQGHLNVLSSMMEWMTKLFEFFTGGNGENDDDEEQNKPQENFDGDEESNFESLEEFKAVARPRAAIIKDVDKSMNALMKSMNQLSAYKKPKENSTLTCIANNLLLVTILMEAIGFVSTLFCFGQNGGEQNPVIEDEWKRTRRSVLPYEEERIIDFISNEYLLFKFNQNSTASFWDEAD